MTFLTLAAATLVSEDLTCVVAGLLIHQGLLDPIVGIAACAFGIYAGDLGLYVAGRRFGGRALEWSVVRAYVNQSRQERMAEWLMRRTAPIVLGSRFVPGSRLPLYVAAGALGVSMRPFAAWSMAAVLLWTPFIVLLSAQSAEASDALLGEGARSWWMRAVAGVIVLASWRLIIRLATRRGRQSLQAALARVWRWEFWPMWLFYAPVAGWLLWLVIRHRGVAAISAANPGIADGGIVGESKHEILRRLPAEWTIPSELISPGDQDARMSRLVACLSRHGWTLPCVLKPDVGQRGTGVKIIRTLDEARDYLTREHAALVLQPYHRGPFEAGVFYYRFPGSSQGRILSITDKHFPHVVGDGRSTLEDLIWAHPRLRMQARTFLQRHDGIRDRVLPDGEAFALGVAGNHCQGTLFTDGRHLITPALERRIDRIARSFEGFCIGRFDIRYGDVERFKTGEDLAIVELNGATAESTNIYDPSSSLLAAYRQLFRQWSLVFAIGAANLDAGAQGSGVRRVFDLLRAHRARTAAFEISD